MTYAVIRAGGKQYRVAVGDTIVVERLPQELRPGESVTFSEVLLKDDGTNMLIGTPTVKGARVEAEIIEIGKAKKVAVMRFRSKVNTGGFKNKGHRQAYCKVRITAIR
ncbi:50S ribosomal protein L21 [Candidatus Parcubacteria bacterium]|nr:MAG: 50S ribosomal protein L21 [Candidatus Parcubacteria bacterium]GIW68956.1 MAG: 50S ribosomal protein L21 [Candidatus Parcubacteria bacterium]